MKDGDNRTSTTNDLTDARGAMPPLPSLDDSSRSEGLAIQFDPLEFVHYLADTGWTDEQKVEYATLVWEIVCEFVAMGFGVHPIQLAQNSSGKPTESDPEAPGKPRKMVDSSHSRLIEAFMHSDAPGTRSDEKESSP